jgi:hypothetical protein
MLRRSPRRLCRTSRARPREVLYAACQTGGAKLWSRARPKSLVSGKALGIFSGIELEATINFCRRIVELLPWLMAQESAHIDP